MKPIVAIERLSFRYAGTAVWSLQDVSLSIQSGEYVAIMGANRAGKTTLALAMNGVIPRMVPGEMTGEVRVKGTSTITCPVREMSRAIGMVLDNPDHQFSQPTVYDEVALGLTYAGVEAKNVCDRVAGALSVMGLEGLETRSPFALSGGQQQRLAIAVAYALSPEVLVMDEPSSQLDPLGKEGLFAAIHDLSRGFGKTVVVTGHEPELFAQYADRLIILQGGRVVQDGPPAEVFGQVDLLSEAGVQAPQVTEVVHRAIGRGKNGVDSYPVTLSQTIELLTSRRGE